MEISQKMQKNNCVRASCLIKLQAEACNFIKKETQAEVFPSELCEISKNAFCYRTPPVAASAITNKQLFLIFSSNIKICCSVRFSHWQPALHKKWTFPLRTSLVNVTKFAISWRSGHIQWRNSQWRTQFFVQCWH